MEDCVYVFHGIKDIVPIQEITHNSLEIGRMAEIRRNFCSGLVRMDECANSEIWILEDKGDNASTLLAVGEGEKNYLLRHRVEANCRMT